MNKWKKRFAWLLTLGLLLGLTACASPAADADPERTAALALYEGAIAPIQAATDLVLTVASTQERQLAGGLYSQSMTGSTSYSGLGTEHFQAKAVQALTFGTYENTYTEFYTGGKAYCQSMNCTFSGSMTAGEFMARQLPAVLLDPQLYTSLSVAESENRTVLTFSDGTALEDWAADADAIFISSSGTVTLDGENRLLQSTYQAKYGLGNCIYTRSVTVKASPAQATGKSLELPDIPDSCVTLSCFDAPKILLQATGDILSTNALTSSCTEELDCQLAGIRRTQQVQMDTWSRSENYLARVDYTADISENSSTPIQVRQTELFIDGKKTVSVDGSEPLSQPEYSADQMRKYCESNALSSLFPAAQLTQAELTEKGDLLHLHFQGTDSLADALCSSIYDNLQTGNLDRFADSCTSSGVEGYLTIHKHSRLPVASGICTGRTHTLEEITYILTYRMDQTLALSSTTAFETIHKPADEG